MTTIQHKRGTSDNWATQNPTLAAGEIGYELDTGKFKIGNGSSDWLSLSYFSTEGTTTVVSGGGTGTGTVTSVDITVPAGLVVSGNPITTSGTLTVAYDTGYAIPTTAKQTDWDTAFGWGNHASAGYQPGDTDLTDIAALSADGLLRKTSGTWGMDTATYLTSYTETDTLASVTGRGATTNSAISITSATSSTSTTTGALKVTGGVGIQENLNVGGNLTLTGDLTVNGTTTTLNSTIVTVDDPIFVLGGDTAPGSDDNKDRGIAFRWHNGATAKIGFFGFDDSSQQFTFVPDATITGEVVSGTVGTIGANVTSANILSTARNIWGQSFDGSGDVTGSLTNVADITSSDTTFSINTTAVTTATGNAIAITGGTTSNTVGTGGSISLTAGSATSSTGANFGGNINIAAGASTVSTSGTGGNVSILAGNGNTKGSISIGTSNTSTITIGAVSPATTTTILGTLTASLNALTISSPLSGTSYNGSSAVSIGLSTGYGDTQNPYGSKSINTVLAGPAGGVSGSPTFRSLVSADIPDLSSTYAALSAATNTFTGDIAVNGGDINSTASTLNIVPTSITTATGRNLSLAGGASTSTGIGNGGDISITGGAATSATTASTGGTITITGGAANTTVGIGGDVVINAGAGSSTNNGVITIGTSNTKSITIGAAGTTTTLAGTISGLVSSVTGTSPVSSTGGSTPAISLSSAYGDTLNPYGSKTTNYVLAGPAGGPSAAPSFRALVAADIPSLSSVYLPLSGGTLTGALTLRAGSTTAGTAPMYFSSSTSLLSTVSAGAIEFNNKALYFTPDVTPGRALVSTPFYKIIATDNSTLINTSPGVATTYSAFGTNGIALDTGVAYEVEMLLLLAATSTSNSSTLIITPGSPSSPATPSTSQFYYDYSESTTVMTNAAATSAVLRTGTTSFPSLNTISIATGTTRYIKAFAKGIINIATGGNFTIRLAFTPTSPATVTGTIYAGSYLKITPLGNEGVTDVGTWA